MADVNGCAPQVTSTTLPAIVQDGTSVEQRSYTSCRRHGDVVWYEISGGGHPFPPLRLSGDGERQRAEHGDGDPGQRFDRCWRDGDLLCELRGVKRAR